MPPESYDLGLDKQEKKKTSAELAKDHIDLVMEKAEGELKKDKRWGRLCEVGGSVLIGVGVVSVAFLLERLSGGGGSQELANALQNMDFGQFLSSPEAKMFFPALSNLGFGTLLVVGGKEKIRQAVAKAKDKKNHILSQYLGRTETPPQT